MGLGGEVPRGGALAGGRAGGGGRFSEGVRRGFGPFALAEGPVFSNRELVVLPRCSVRRFRSICVFGSLVVWVVWVPRGGSVEFPR
jgi:hypothetical protein